MPSGHFPVISGVIGVTPVDPKDMLSIGLSVLFSVLIGSFGPLVGLILVAYILGAITGGWLIPKHESAAR
jgi:branched-subunit amino acid ABC-type transport system permease component